jgi:hypothetical protein
MCSIGQQDLGSVGLSDNLLVENELAVADWKAIVGRLGVHRVNIVGVEPLLYAEFDRILAAIAPGRMVHVTTNGWLIAKWFDALRQYAAETTVSLDGMAETHDAIRGVKGSFERGFTGVVRLREAGRRVRVSFAITPDNVADMAPLHQSLAARGIPIVFNHFNYIHPDSCRGYPCTPVNMNVYNPADVDLDRLHENIARLADATFLPVLTTREELEAYYRSPPTRRVRTDAGCVVLGQILAGTRFVIAADGKFIPGNRCWIEKPLGNAKDGDLPSQASWLAETVADIREHGLYPPCQRLCCAGNALE